VVASSSVSLSNGGSGEGNGSADLSTEATPTSSAISDNGESTSSAPPFDPLFLTTFGYEGLNVALGLPSSDTERILFSIDNPRPSIDNGRSGTGNTGIANNYIGPIPYTKGDHTLYIQYVDANGTPGEIYSFDYTVDDIVFNFSQQPYDFETESTPAIFTMAIVDSDPNALYDYAYSVDTQTLDQSVEGVGQAGVITLTGLAVGNHVLYVQASREGEKTAVVTYHFTIE
jgi:hypothetical protein